MPSRVRLLHRMKVLEGQRRRRPGPRRTWSLIGDVELDRLEGLAIRADRAHDQAAFLADLDAHDRTWLTALRARLDDIAGRLGIAFAVGGSMA